MPGGYFEITGPITKWDAGVVLAVQAEGYAPQVVTWTEAEASDPETTITVLRGAPTGGRVIDEDANPIQVVMKPDETDREFVMIRPLVFSGTVRDAGSGDPIPRFQAILGSQFKGGDRPHWNRHRTTDGSNGVFRIEVGEPSRDRQRLIRIEAEGYLPFASEALPEQSVADLTFQLEPGEDLAGYVVRSDGSAVTNARLALATRSETVGIREGRLRDRRGRIVATTDAGGRFAFPPEAEDWRLVAVNDHGHAELRGTGTTDMVTLTLEPWGRIEGEIRTGSQPVPDAEISFNVHESYKPGDENRPRVHYYTKTRSDAEGRFVLERVVPRFGRVSEMQSSAGDQPGSFISRANRSVPVDVRPGDTHYVQIGGRGRPVMGTVEVPAAFRDAVDLSTAGCLIETVDLGEPPGIENVPGSEKRAWLEAFRESPEGKQWSRDRTTRRTHYQFTPVTADGSGSFLVHDIPAGTYRLRVGLGHMSRSESTERALRGGVNHVFEVPEMAGGRSDVPLDLGTIPMSVVREVLAGDPAHPFDLVDGHGQRMQLGQFRGRFILLVFWSSMRADEDPAYLHDLRSLHERYGSRLAIIGLNSDHYVDMAEAFVEKHGLPWRQVYRGSGEAVPLQLAYPIPRRPGFVLIDPAGTVAANDLSAEDLWDRMVEALK